jgi:hypothetical protein
MSNLVEHARRELTALNYDQETLDGFLNVIQAFADMGHSGGSASVAIPTLNELLQFKNLSPLTNDPAEWIHIAEEVWGEHGGVWQNVRNGTAFSSDGGKTYTRLDDPKDGNGNKPIYTSVIKDNSYPVEDSPTMGFYTVDEVRDTQ